MKPLLDILQRFRHAQLLVVGDLMLDRFIWGDVERISPEAPVPVMRVMAESHRLGGAANVINNIRLAWSSRDRLRGHRTRYGREAASA